MAEVHFMLVTTLHKPQTPNCHTQAFGYVVEVCGGSWQLLQILNKRLGCASSRNICDMMTTVMKRTAMTWSSTWIWKDSSDNGD